MGVLRPHEVTGPSVGTGVFGGYLYMSGSAMRLFGVRMPGMSPRDADEQVMGEVTDLPPYRRAKGDRNLIASLALSRYVLAAAALARPRAARRGPPRRAGMAGDDARAGFGDRRAAAGVAGDVPASASSEHEAAAAVQRAGRCAARACSTASSPAPAIPPGLANRIVGGTGDVDSAQLAQRLWALGRLVAADATLSAIVRRRPRRASPAARSTPRCGPAVDAFLADHGHRGNDEYELATPAWVMDPAPVYAAIDRLRHAPADRDPVDDRRRLAADADDALAEAIRLVPRRLRWIARRCALVARQGSIGRERAKDILVLENLGARLVLHELVRRAADAGGPRDVRLAFCVTATELADFVATPERRSPT